MPIATLADRLEGRPIEEKQAKMLAREAADFISQAHDIGDRGDYQRAVDLCDAACKDFSLAYRAFQEFQDRRTFCAPLDATIFTKHFFAAKLYDEEGKPAEVLKEIEAAREIYETSLKVHPDLFLPSFDRYLEEMEELERKAKEIN